MIGRTLIDSVSIFIV